MSSKVVTIRNNTISLPIDFADIAIMNELRKFADKLIKQEIVDYWELTRIITDACPNLSSEIASYSVHTYPDGSFAPKGKKLVLYLEEVSAVLYAVGIAYVEQLVERKRFSLAKMKDKLTPEEKAKVLNDVARLEKEIKNFPDEIEQYQDTLYRYVLLEENVGQISSQAEEVSVPEPAIAQPVIPVLTSGESALTKEAEAQELRKRLQELEANPYA